jgi:hypothetical protein
MLSTNAGLTASGKSVKHMNVGEPAPNNTRNLPRRRRPVFKRRHSHITFIEQLLALA